MCRRMSSHIVLSLVISEDVLGSCSFHLSPAIHAAHALDINPYPG